VEMSWTRSHASWAVRHLLPDRLREPRKLRVLPHPSIFRGYSIFMKNKDRGCSLHKSRICGICGRNQPLAHVRTDGLRVRPPAMGQWIVNWARLPSTCSITHILSGQLVGVILRTTGQGRPIPSVWSKLSRRSAACGVQATRDSDIMTPQSVNREFYGKRSNEPLTASRCSASGWQARASVISHAHPGGVGTGPTVQSSRLYWCA